MLDKIMQATIRTDKLVDLAKRVREHSYAPYSHFKVGAAVLMSSGEIYTGCNVENISYGLSNCAERAAIFNAIAAGESEIVAVAIVTEGEPVFPCGACLQVIREFAGEEPPVIISANTESNVITKRLSELLPYAFDSFKSEG